MTACRTAGLLGPANKIGSDFDIHIRRGAGAYVCGEEGSLLNSLEGKHPFPRNRPPFPVTHGYMQKPTVVNNVETLAAVPHILRHGAQWYRDLGRGDLAGTKGDQRLGRCAAARKLRGALRLSPVRTPLRMGWRPAVRNQFPGSEHGGAVRRFSVGERLRRDVGRTVAAEPQLHAGGCRHHRVRRYARHGGREPASRSSSLPKSPAASVSPAASAPGASANGWMPSAPTPTAVSGWTMSTIWAA